jgi:GDP/UDP-N,N'-diacetylbacillosamine 2-epimerase (hydrolysing)
MSKRRICVVTGTRAEYGLLFWLMKGIKEDKSLELQIIVTGMHLSPEFGLTYEVIENDGFKINHKVEMLLSADTPSAISKSTGIGLIGIADAYNMLKPDLVVLLGDRYEIFSASVGALFARIPIAHIHGGETTSGAFDEALRHSITKMATLHFVAADPYRKRVIQLGENPGRVMTVGGLGVENIKKIKLLDKEKLENNIRFKFGKKNLLVTFHPVTLENSTSEQQFKTLLDCLERLVDTHIIFTKSNSDSDGRIINELINDFVIKRNNSAIAFSSMGQLSYLSAMQFVDAVVGNSSSGLTEAPSFKIGTINVGDRQKGRLKAESIIDCNPAKKEIEYSIAKLYSEDFQQKLKEVKNPYDGGLVSDKILNTIKTIQFPVNSKKEFFDL